MIFLWQSPGQMFDHLFFIIKLVRDSLKRVREDFNDFFPAYFRRHFEQLSQRNFCFGTRICFVQGTYNKSCQGKFITLQIALNLEYCVGTTPEERFFSTTLKFIAHEVLIYISRGRVSIWKNSPPAQKNSPPKMMMMMP